MESPLPQPNEPIDLVVELVTLHRDDNGEYEDEHVVEYRNSRWFHVNFCSADTREVKQLKVERNKIYKQLYQQLKINKKYESMIEAAEKKSAILKQQIAQYKSGAVQQPVVQQQPVEQQPEQQQQEEEQPVEQQPEEQAPAQETTA